MPGEPGLLAHDRPERQRKLRRTLLYTDRTPVPPTDQGRGARNHARPYLEPGTD